VEQPLIPEKEWLERPAALHGRSKARSPGAESYAAGGHERAAEEGQAEQPP
jgi:hypothetical protein